MLAEAGHAPDPANEPTLPEVEAAFEAIEAASGAAAKAEVLDALIARSSPRTATGIVKVLSGELRIGLREGLLEAAIAKAFDRPLDAVKRAGMLTGDVGRTATLAREDRLGEAALTLFHPLKFMLASPAEDAAEIIGRLGPTVWVEDKYDGIRAQLHRAGDEVRLYSRDLHDISGQFPEVVAGARGLPWAGILDGELLAWRDGVVLPFLQLQARLGRKNPSAKILAEIPVIFVAWDVLGLDARPGPDRRVPARGAADGAPAPARGAGPAARQRRRRASRSATSPRWTRWTASRRRSLEARARRNEGLMVKDPDSRYSPGRRGLGWLKMKKALATLDCVVVGVEVGHGKRHGVLSDYTFAVRDDETGDLVTIGKAYSGLTDAEIAEMTRWFEAHTLAHLRPLPGRRADGRGRGRVRRDHALGPPQVGLRPPLPADRAACARTSPPRRSTRWRRSPACSRDCSTARSTW